MLKIYAVLYLAGKVAFAVGPWPDDAMDVCLETTQETQRLIDEEFAHIESLTRDGIVYKKSDFVPTCGRFLDKPQIGDPIR